MSDLSALTSSTATAPAAPTTSLERSGLDRDAFLQMLVAQLSNQDPLNPQQGHEFAAQLAEFTTVEQLDQINKSLAAHTELLASLDAAALRQGDLTQLLADRTELSTALGLIGQTVDARADAVRWDGAEPVPIGVSLASPAETVRLEVRDATGAVVRRIEAGPLGEGQHTFTWDGLDEAGQPAVAGTYALTLTATDDEGGAVEAASLARGRVDRITADENGIAVWIDGREVPLGNVLAVSE